MGPPKLWGQSCWLEGRLNRVILCNFRDPQKHNHQVVGSEYLFTSKYPTWNLILEGNYHNILVISSGWAMKSINNPIKSISSTIYFRAASSTPKTVSQDKVTSMSLVFNPTWFELTPSSLGKFHREYHLPQRKKATNEKSGTQEKQRSNSLKNKGQVLRSRHKPIDAWYEKVQA